MMKNQNLWITLSAVFIISMAILGFYGVEIYREAPPIPDIVRSTDGQVIFRGSDIQDGRAVWQSIGGQELGSIWGHGAYQAPDWSADWLHREALQILNEWSTQEHSKLFEELSEKDQELLRLRLVNEVRPNTYNEETKVLTVSDTRLRAIQQVSAHYTNLFMGHPSGEALRESYAMKKFTVKDASRMEKLNAFFFWSSWATVTNRPGKNFSYTNNWPPEKLVANEPPSSLMLWSGFSVILLLSGIGALASFYASKSDQDIDPKSIPASDPFLALKLTPSMKATVKYFGVVLALILLQIGLGVLTAHYGVEGRGFFGIPLAEILPASLTRTWHLQIGIFWIATSWLATGLFVGPSVSGSEPKWQRLGVNFLFVCLLIIVFGSLFGQWAGIMQKLELDSNFWIGHQGYEYVDLGRFWQIFLFVGLMLWFVLMSRSLLPAFKQDRNRRQLLMLFLISSAAIGLFYGAGLMWGKKTNLAVVEYWRWWVVHLWVEGFFEVFATVVIAFIFVRLGLLNVERVTKNVVFATSIFLLGGILGTFHHLYFTGTPTAVLALGASFSALEVVPLMLMGFEAFSNLRLGKAKPWVQAYRWPIYCFISVAFWNLVGAGVFGFLINPPIALYYMQGLNTTPVHGHSALFGVYGMLGIGLMLFVMRTLTLRQTWNSALIRTSLWSLNIGLGLMVFLSALPIGILQTIASMDRGYWYARSADFLGTPLIANLRWLRTIGDVIFAFGGIGLVLFVIGLGTSWSLQSTNKEDAYDLDNAKRHF